MKGYVGTVFEIPESVKMAERCVESGKQFGVDVEIFVDGPISAILQAKIDNEYQGRVMTLFGSVINLSGPIGLIAAGPVSDAWGIQIWFITAGLLIFGCMAFGFLNKDLMQIGAGPQTESD